MRVLRDQQVGMRCMRLYVSGVEILHYFEKLFHFWFKTDPLLDHCALSIGRILLRRYCVTVRTLNMVSISNEQFPSGHHERHSAENAALSGE